MRISSRVPAATALLAGLLLTSACAATEELSGLPSAPAEDAASSTSSPASSPSTTSPTTKTSSGTKKPKPSPTSTKATTRTPTAAGGVFSGTRQVRLLPKNSESTLGVVQEGKIGLSERFGDNELFVLTKVKPGGDQYWIRTAKLRKGGEPLCLSAKLGSGGAPAPVVTTACDSAASSQLFRFRRSGDSNGKPTYTIRTGQDTFIIQDPTGEIAHTGTGVAAVSIGEGTPDIDTPFIIADKGKATIPALD